MAPRTNIVAIILCIFVAFGGILFGYDTGTISGVQENAYWQRQFGSTVNADGTVTISTSQKSMIVSILSVGTFFGALLASPFGDYLGRKWALFASCWVFCVGVAMQTASTGIGLFTGGRVIAGLGVGLVSCLVPMYQAEAAPARIRGALIGCYQFAITIGILVASVVNNACKDYTSDAGWRWVISVQFMFAGLLAVGMIFLPDTPRSLIRKGKMEEATKSLARLRSAPIDDPELLAELDEIRANLEYEKQVGEASYIDCFKGVSLRRSLLGIFIQMFQQCNPYLFCLTVVTGVNFIFYYGTSFFKISGFTDPFLSNMITTIVNVCMTLPGLYMVERLGRRKLLLYGAAVMTISQFIVGIVGVTAASGRENSPKAALNAIIAFVCIFIAGFAASWGPVAWILTGELFTLKTRAKQMSMATASNWYTLHSD